MYQATAMKLTQENTQKDQQLAAMGANIDSGIAPSEEIEKEWTR